MYLLILGVLLLAMKMMEFGPVANWSWLVVLAPFAGAVAWWSWADASGWTKRREMDKLDALKQERRLKALDNLGMDRKGRAGRSTKAKIERTQRRTTKSTSS